jgi:hypothetical protein
MALFGLFKKRGRSATDTIDLTRMQSVKDKLKADAAASAATPITGTETPAQMPSMDLPMGTFDQNVGNVPATSYQSYSYSQTNDDKIANMQGKFTVLTQRVDLLEHKIDRLERKTGIKSESEI